MGFSALDGLMMGTRCGSIDPGVLLYLLDQEGMDSGALNELLYKQSGLWAFPASVTTCGSCLRTAAERPPRQ